jgi:NADPH2:quinone reductase
MKGKHMKTSIPKFMLAVLTGENGGPQITREVPVPHPGPGEVLVRMAAAPINPSDIGFMKGSYGDHGSTPVVPGFEGSGTVIASGTGLFPRLLLGKRVACFGSPSGTWAEYLVTRAALCVPLKKDISSEQGAMMLVNPLTALAFFTIAKRDGHEAIVNTAAASALGRMILRLGRRHQVPVINVVRRADQADLLTTLGAEYVLESTDRNFVSTLLAMMQRLKATLILDAVGGELAEQLLDAAPFGSTLLLYANLSGERLSIESRTLWKDDKRIEGFFLGNWAKGRNMNDALRDIHTIRQRGATDLQTHVQKRLPLTEINQAVALYQSNMTAGKVLLVADPKAIPLE